MDSLESRWETPAQHSSAVTPIRERTISADVPAAFCSAATIVAPRDPTRGSSSPKCFLFASCLNILVTSEITKCLSTHQITFLFVCRRGEGMCREGRVSESQNIQVLPGSLHFSLHLERQRWSPSSLRAQRYQQTIFLQRFSPKWPTKSVLFFKMKHVLKICFIHL